MLISAIETVPHPKQTEQHTISARESYDLNIGAGVENEKDDLQGSSSFGYGYYSYPYLGGGYYGGYYPSYGGIYGLGYPYYGGYYGGYPGFHGHYW
ncbi:glycine-rich protein 3 [Anastrepha obliqua]|uniref:glycine-rich protein 3 n=1 Tax=Anastrepha obliqua TaxID=95512 RepID=UPI00240A19F2|nr:glycine-rich protein 3 [Anastrepha obliqua]